MALYQLHRPSKAAVAPAPHSKLRAAAGIPPKLDRPSHIPGEGAPEKKLQICNILAARKQDMLAAPTCLDRDGGGVMTNLFPANARLHVGAHLEAALPASLIRELALDHRHDCEVAGHYKLHLVRLHEDQGLGHPMVSITVVVGTRPDQDDRIVTIISLADEWQTETGEVPPAAEAWELTKGFKDYASPTNVNSPRPTGNGG